MYAKHNKEVRSLLADYANGCHQRVPVGIAFDEQFLLPLWDCTYKRYYLEATTQVDIQLKSMKWIRENILQDAEMGLPDVWHINPVFWMAENEFLGAEITIQENDYAWGKPISLSKTELLKQLGSMDVTKRIQQETLFHLYRAMRDYTKDLEFCGRPVEVSLPVTTTHGIFTKAAEIRGLDQICMDMYEDPPFVQDLLGIITGLTIERIKTWHILTKGSERDISSCTGWGIADDSIAMISRQQYEEFVLPYHKKLYAEMARGPRYIHLCGHAQHLFKTLHDNLSITVFNGPGPQIDLLRMVEEIDGPIEIQAQVAHGTLLGPHAEIEAAVLKILSEELLRRSKVRLFCYVPGGASLENINFFYACGRRHGKIPNRKEEK